MMEIEGTSLNFLKLKIINRDGQLIFGWYYKSTFSGRILNYHSKHPIAQKRGVIMSLIDKVLLLSHPEFQQKNFSDMINILLNNNYPLDMIFLSIKKS